MAPRSQTTGAFPMVSGNRTCGQSREMPGRRAQAPYPLLPGHLLLLSLSLRSFPFWTPLFPTSQALSGDPWVPLSSTSVVLQGAKRWGV